MNRQTFERIYEQYGERVYSFMLSRTKNSDIAQDLTSQTFARAWEFRTECKGRLRSWLYTIAYHELCQYWRTDGYLHCQPLDDAPNLIAETLPDPRRFEDELEKYEDAARARAACAKVKNGAALELAANGYSRAQLTKWFGVGVSTLNRRLWTTCQEVRALCPAL